MKMVMMNGGLGNQVFQYIFARFLEYATGQPCIIDDMAFCVRKPEHNGYELERIWGLRPQRLSEQLDEDVVREICDTCFERGNEPVCMLLQNFGLSMDIVQEGRFLEGAYGREFPHVISCPPNEYTPKIAALEHHTYYYGYWFGCIKDIIRKELTFPPLTDERNIQMLEQIQSDDDAVAIHIRRGDFVKLGRALDSSFYDSSIQRLRKVIATPRFYIFTDDIPWVKEHLGEYGLKFSDCLTFMEGNTGEKSYIDMQLMAASKNMVIANSSFSYLAALLNTKQEKLVLNPLKSRKII